MKISFQPILFAFLFLTIWTVAMPTPKPPEPEAILKRYYDELGARSAERARELVSRKLHISASAKRVFGKIGSIAKKVGRGIVNGVKGIGNVVNKVNVIPLPIPFL
jgi:hypothetical protein